MLYMLFLQESLQLQKDANRKHLFWSNGSTLLSMIVVFTKLMPPMKIMPLTVFMTLTDQYLTLNAANGIS